ncbi:uncharacterized protein N7473_004259 [Penicillium subrubescens]|uniref:Uncharacterized protein n=1 Tax=Penicillium subrubescens TaxID=1316194 RepID=A0A1Q5UBD7_9EURO|nr:uncharacterized protein N7473_004259 [Penicillium subrubescens]KAJ5900189.1 hypothetical protein N7473_004259 [Penicillium subrubescens]OKP09783.1 hypothetical protein PENSUB_4824 [Penicillium subrubescens]
MKIDDQGVPKVVYHDLMYQAYSRPDYIDLPEFWSTSSDIPATPPLLATEYDDLPLDSFLEGQPIDSGGSLPPPMECLLFPDPGNLQSGFNWPGPDPLFANTQSEDVLVYMSASIPTRLLHWVDICLTELDQMTDQTIEKYRFHLSSTANGREDLYWVRRQILDIISGTRVKQRSLFRLSLRPRTELSTRFPDPACPLHTTQPSATCLDPDVFVQNLTDNRWPLW